MKRIVDSFSTSERDSKDAPDPDLVARVARGSMSLSILPQAVSGVVLDGKIEQPPQERAGRPSGDRTSSHDLDSGRLHT